VDFVLASEGTNFEDWLVQFDEQDFAFETNYSPKSFVVVKIEDCMSEMKNIKLAK
jgi:hypothetical protein